MIFTLSLIAVSGWVVAGIYAYSFHSLYVTSLKFADAAEQLLNKKTPS